MVNAGIPLSEITSKIYKGSSTGNDDIFLLKRISESGGIMEAFSVALHKNIKIEKSILKPFLYGSDARKYSIEFGGNYLIYPYELIEDKMILVEADDLEKRYPLAYKYLVSLKDELVKRAIDVNGKSFYKYSAARSLREYAYPKILVPDMLVENRMSVDLDGKYYHGPAIHSVVFNKKVSNYKALYFLGIFNSKLFWFFISRNSTALRGNAYRLTPQYIEKMPIKLLDLSKAEDVKKHDRMVSLVEQMLELNKQLPKAKTEQDKTVIQRQIEGTDREIDKLVYELYGLTEEEIKVVEG
jgi:adenine-specific DNA-methyltransferase